MHNWSKATGALSHKALTKVGGSYHIRVGMLEATMSRLDSHACASSSSTSCASKVVCRQQNFSIHTPALTAHRVRPASSRRQATMMASDKKDKNFNPFRNKKKEVRVMTHLLHETKLMPFHLSSSKSACVHAGCCEEGLGADVWRQAGCACSIRCRWWRQILGECLRHRKPCCPSLLYR